jgi:hypothetical protein
MICHDAPPDAYAVRCFGTRVAYARSWEDAVSGGWRAGWRDARGRREIGISSDDGPLDLGTLWSVAVDAHGAIAFLSAVDVVDAPVGPEAIGYAAPGHRPRVIARVRGVPRASLAVVGGSVVWRSRSGPGAARVTKAGALTEMVETYAARVVAAVAR